VVGSDMTAHLLSKGLLLGVLLGLGLRTPGDALVAESLVPAGRRLSDGDLRPGRGRQRNRLHGHLAASHQSSPPPVAASRSYLTNASVSATTNPYSASARTATRL